MGKYPLMFSADNLKSHFLADCVSSRVCGREPVTRRRKSPWPGSMMCNLHRASDAPRRGWADQSEQACAGELGDMLLLRATSGRDLFSERVPGHSFGKGRMS